jgi:hypothetical protein
MRLRTLTASLALATTLACSSNEDPGGGDTSPVRAFQSDALPSGTVIYVRQKEISADALVLEIASRNVSDLYGLAWRLRYDPAVVRAVQMEPTTFFGANNVHALREAEPGLFVAAVSEKGKKPGSAATDTALAVIDFELLAAKETRIDFVAERSTIVQSDGTHAAPVQWVGGALSAQ